MSFPSPDFTAPSQIDGAILPPAAPSLPQQDTPAEQAARAAQLAATRQVYMWTTDEPSLPGVPLATDVPKQDMPTIAWFAILIGVGLAIVRNALAVKLDGVDKGELDTPRSTYEAALAECDAIEQSTARIAAGHAMKDGTSLLGHFVDEVEHVVAAVEADTQLAKLEAHRQRIEALIKVSAAEVAGLGRSAPRSLDAYRALFRTLPVPGVAYDFQDDACFARLRVQGPRTIC